MSSQIFSSFHSLYSPTAPHWNRALDQPHLLVPVRLLLLLQIRPPGMLVFGVLQCLLMIIQATHFLITFSIQIISLISPTDPPSMTPSHNPSPLPSVVHSQSPSYMPTQVPSLSSSPSAEPSFTPTSSPTTPVSVFVQRVLYVNPHSCIQAYKILSSENSTFI